MNITDNIHAKVKLNAQSGYRWKLAILMVKMGLATIYPKPNTSVPNKEHEVFPYLLREIDMTRPNLHQGMSCLFDCHYGLWMGIALDPCL
jgi:hypothetical protein